MSSDSTASDRKLHDLAPTEILPANPPQRVYEETQAYDSSASGSQGASAPPAQPTELTTELPKEFGRYRVIKLLGRGGMGSVYLAQDTQLDRPVALKIPRMEADRHGRLMARFEREAKAVAQLNHPHICPVFDVGEIAGHHFLAMAYIKGKPLTSFLSKSGPQPERGIASTIYKIALAIEEAHASGILHRDLKPANIMVDSRGEPIVMDFGLSHRLNDDGESRLTQEGTVIGTPAYMAPEQIDGREPISPATDVYSLGVVMYELLTGKCPFEGSVVSVIGQVLHSTPPAIEDTRSDLSPALVEICQRAMAKQPADRYPTMKAFANDLASFLRGKTTVVATQPVTKPSPAAENSGNSWDDLLASELEAASTGPSPAFLAAPQGNTSSSLLKILVPATAGVLLLLVTLAWGFRSSPEAEVTRPADDTLVAQADVEKTPALASASSIQAPAVVSSLDEEAGDPKKSVPQDSDDDFFPKTSASPPAPSASSQESSLAEESSGNQPGVDPESGNSQVNPADPSTASANNTVPKAPQKDDADPSESDTSFAEDLANKDPASKSADRSKAPPERNPLSFPTGPGERSAEPPRRSDAAADEKIEMDSVEYLQKIFHDADRNHDEMLDPGETPMHIIHRADRNNDHVASLREMETAFKLFKEDLFKPPTPAELKNLQKAGPGGRGPGGRGFGPDDRRPGGFGGGKPPGPPPQP